MQSRQHRFVKINHVLTFESGGAQQTAKTDVCVLYDDKVVLLVQEASEGDIIMNEPQLIAWAIAAFANNQRALEAEGRPRLTILSIPGILMVGATPIFYKIQITEGLHAAVRTTTFPTIETVVERFVPFPGQPLHLVMANMSSRRRTVQCIETFHHFLDVAQGNISVF